MYYMPEILHCFKYFKLYSELQPCTFFQKVFLLLHPRVISPRNASKIQNRRPNQKKLFVVSGNCQMHLHRPAKHHRPTTITCTQTWANAGPAWPPVNRSVQRVCENARPCWNNNHVVCKCRNKNTCMNG